MCRQLCSNIVVETGESSKKRKKVSKCGKPGRLIRDDGGHKSDCNRKSKAAVKAKEKTVRTKETRPGKKGEEPANTDEASHLAFIAHIDSVMSEFQDMKNKLLMKSLPSPRESSKGQKTRSTNSLPEKVKHVGVGKAARRDLSSNSSNPIACPSASSSALLSDPLSLGTWDMVRDVPPCQVNGMAHPVGQFWKHMKNFAFERAA